MELFRLKKQRDLCLFRLDLLRDQINQDENYIQKVKYKTTLLQKTLKEKKQQLKDSKSFLAGQVQRMESQYPTTLQNLEKSNAKLFKRLQQHRQYLVAELLSFFPLNPVSETEYAIVNIKLPNAFTDWKGLPNEVVSAALGYLVHFHNVMVTYLDVVLPYKMEFFGSRSKLWRDGSPKQYLLYNSDEEEFRIALEMLNWNVVHFCLSQGESSAETEPEHTLPNLLQTLRSPNLGSVHIARDRTSKGNRRRAVSISSLTMPLATSYVSPPVRPLAGSSGAARDDEDFVVIDSQLPQVKEEDSDTENTLFM